MGPCGIVDRIGKPNGGKGPNISFGAELLKIEGIAGGAIPGGHDDPQGFGKRIGNAGIREGHPTSQKGHSGVVIGPAQGPGVDHPCERRGVGRQHRHPNLSLKGGHGKKFGPASSLSQSRRHIGQPATESAHHADALDTDPHFTPFPSPEQGPHCCRRRPGSGKAPQRREPVWFGEPETPAVPDRSE